MGKIERAIKVYSFIIWIFIHVLAQLTHKVKDIKLNGVKFKDICGRWPWLGTGGHCRAPMDTSRHREPVSTMLRALGNGPGRAVTGGRHQQAVSTGGHQQAPSGTTKQWGAGSTGHCIPTRHRAVGNSKKQVSPGTGTTRHNTPLGSRQHWAPGIPTKYHRASLPDTGQHGALGSRYHSAASIRHHQTSNQFRRSLHHIYFMFLGPWVGVWH